MAQHKDSRRTDDDISAMLRGALGDAEFDYESLVGGVHRRAGRIRRRRAIATGAAVAVLGPALVGGAALVLPDVLGDDATVVGPAATSDAPMTTSEEPADDSERTTEDTAAVEDPPWQDGTLPPPIDPDTEGSVPNEWEIPDARPTGVAVLEELGAPQSLRNYPRTPAVMDLMVCNDGGLDGGLEPLAGQGVTYFSDATGNLSVTIQVTGWEDSGAAMDGLGTQSSCTWDDRAGEPQPWPGHEGDDDYLLIPGTEPGLEAAVVRQGDYLVAVTLRDEAGDWPGTDVVTEIASKQAENLEALDPDHGRD